MSAMAAREAPSEIWVARDQSIGRAVIATVRRQQRLIIGFTLGFPLFFYLMLLGLLMVRFGHLPNYVTPYDWFGNVWRIIVSTGSASDIFQITMDEWLLEIGFMNYAYGLGVSEWSLLIIPHKIAIMMAIGTLIGLNFALIADQKPAASLIQQHVRSARCGLMTSVGALGASLTGITLYWVICHSGPTWVVSLAILGVDLSTTLALEPIGPAISVAGGIILVLSALLIVRDIAADRASESAQPAKKAMPC